MKRAVFLDRDGVICEDVNYLHHIEDCRFIPGAIAALKKLQDAGFALVIVTNQGGIAHGIYTDQDFHTLNDWMLAELAHQGVLIDRVYYCPHHPQAEVLRYRRDCDCRKPKPGMLTKAVQELKVDLAHSFMIGDKTLDIKAGKDAGCTAILVRTGYGGNDKAYKAAPDVSCEGLSEAAQYILSR